MFASCPTHSDHSYIYRCISYVLARIRPHLQSHHPNTLTFVEDVIEAGANRGGGGLGDRLGRLDRQRAIMILSLIKHHQSRATAIIRLGDMYRQ